jgi:hypothetical protein
VDELHSKHVAKQCEDVGGVSNRGEADLDGAGGRVAQCFETRRLRNAEEHERFFLRVFPPFRPFVFQEPRHVGQGVLCAPPWLAAGVVTSTPPQSVDPTTRRCPSPAAE